ncbi:MAG: acyltransferase [Bacteroidales bacterium]|nr:acyltransferase [Bacteroidales bacterium]
MQTYSISKEDTTLIKGLAIFCIVMHNFFHWMPPSPGENEFLFDERLIQNFFSLLTSKPSEIINILFSYLGHYGVQIFIFISGVGLTYSMKKNERSWGNFMGYRLKKLYPLLLTGIIVFFISTILTTKSLVTKLEWHELTYKMLFLHTLLPNSGLKVVGPWWFFGLIMQLYLLFSFLYKFIEKYNWRALIALCIISYGCFFISHTYFHELRDISLMQNAPGHLPEFCFGIWFAQNRDKKIPILWLFISIALFVLGNFFQVCFPFTFISVTIIFLFAYPYLKKLICWKQNYLQSFFLFLGNLSMIIFVVHTIFRPPFIDTFSSYHNAGISLLAGVLFFVTIIGIALTSKKIYDNLSFLFNKITFKKQSRFLENTILLFVVIFFCYIMFYYMMVKFSNHKEIIEPQYSFQQNFVTEKEAYTSIAKYTITDKPYKTCTDIEFDYVNETDNKPILVFSIPGRVWQKYFLEKGVKNQDGSYHYTIHYRYIRPFIQWGNSLELSIYLWNYNHSVGEIKNTSVTVYNEK